jgi:hypothetical protein
MNRIRRHVRLATVLALTTAAAVAWYAQPDGGPTMGSVHGRVTLNGRPVAVGSITFTPVNRDAPTAAGLIEGGAYTAKVPATRHRVVISSPQSIARGEGGADPLTGEEVEVREVIPARYNTKSDLTLEVVPGEAEVNFYLKN